MFGFRKKNIDGVVTIEIPNLKGYIDNYLIDSSVLIKTIKEHTISKDNIMNFEYEVKKVIDKHFDTNGEDTVECETCGCLLNKSTAFRGESTIEKTNNTIFDFKPVQEIIKENYYCKIHKPKEKK